MAELLLVRERCRSCVELYTPSTAWSFFAFATKEVVLNTVVLVAQVVAALGIMNVWLLRPQKATAWRGGEATNMREEFAVYGLPEWFMFAVGLLKLTFAALLIAGVWFPAVTKPAALGLGALMLAAVVMHLKVGDPLRKSLPAFTVLILCVVIALA